MGNCIWLNSIFTQKFPENFGKLFLLNNMKITQKLLKQIIKEALVENQFLSIEELDSLRTEWKRRASADISQVMLVHWRYPDMSGLDDVEQIVNSYDREREFVVNGFGALPLIGLWAAENPGESVGVLLQGDIECAFKRDVESFSGGGKLYPRVCSESEFWEVAALSLSDFPRLAGPLHNEFFVSNWEPVALVVPQALRDAIEEWSEEFVGFTDRLNTIAQTADLPVLNEFAKKDKL